MSRKGQKQNQNEKIVQAKTRLVTSNSLAHTKQIMLEEKQN
jgi:hypothetical protein